MTNTFMNFVSQDRESTKRSRKGVEEQRLTLAVKWKRDMDNVVAEETQPKKEENEIQEKKEDVQAPILSEGRQKVIGWIDKHFRIVMTDGRILIGYFLCTDRDANIILGTCEEYLKSETEGEEPRFLGLVMVPGRHIVSIQLNDKTQRKNPNRKPEVK